MEVLCSQCQTKLRIPDEKIPEHQTVVLACPKCRNRIPIERQKRQPVRELEPIDVQHPVRSSVPDESEAYDSADRPFDFIAPGAKTAMICSSDMEVRSMISAELMALGYYPIMPQSCEEGLKRMRFHVFNLVIVDERFDADPGEMHPILDHIHRLAMDIRRTMFVVLLSDRFRTMDDMAAFHQSVNLVINDRNVGEFTKILKRATADHEAFYSVFFDCMTKLGKSS
ncbi:MAG: zinc-ribbon domain-containing protein [Thermodesulfobacteriota bacterium]